METNIWLEQAVIEGVITFNEYIRIKRKRVAEYKNKIMEYT